MSTNRKRCSAALVNRELPTTIKLNIIPTTLVKKKSQVCIYPALVGLRACTNVNSYNLLGTLFAMTSCVKLLEIL